VVYIQQGGKHLWAAWSGDQIPVGGEIFHACPDWPWGPTSLPHSKYRFFSGDKVALSMHPHVVLRLKKEYSYTFIACYRVNFTFTFKWGSLQIYYDTAGASNFVQPQNIKCKEYVYHTYKIQ
jgi:hypothetical protein